MKKLIYLFLVVIFLPKFSFAVSDTLVIHSFQISGTDSSTDEFVAIKNVSQGEINLEKYTLVKKTQSSATWNTLIEFPSTIILPGQILVVSHANYTSQSDFKYTSANYSIAPNNSIAIRRPDKSIIDLVGLGDSISYEGASVQNPEATEILRRISDIDTDNNQVDFELIKNVTPAVVDSNVLELVISEIMPNPIEGKEWFEIYNPTSQTVSLLGLKICDGIGAIKCYYFKNDEILNSFEYKIYSQDLTKITLNNSGDFLEIIGPNEEILVSTGDNYGDAEKGYSLSIFGSEYKWTFSSTPAKANIFSEVAFEEDKPSTKKSSAKKTTIKKASAIKQSEGDSEAEDPNADVKGASAEIKAPLQKEGYKIDNRVFGAGLMVFSIVLLLGYNLWLKKDEIAKAYYKIRSRNN
jgi:hypothetical protein